jgi:hypothetical protein
MTDRIGDQLAADYLRRLEAALAGAPPDRRHELLEEIGAHLAEARAELPADDERAVRELLDRLGEPGEIAAAALVEADAGAPDDAPAGFGGAASASPAVAPSPPRPGWKEGLAVPLLLIGAFFFLVGWFAGVALLWASNLWSFRDKVIGTLLLPFGWLGAFMLAFSGGSVESCSGWIDDSGKAVEECTGGGVQAGPLILFALLVLIPLASSVYLLLRLRAGSRAAATPPPAGMPQSRPA